MRPASAILIIGALLLLLVAVGCVRRDDGNDQRSAANGGVAGESPGDEPATGQPMRLTDAGAQRSAPARSASVSTSVVDPRDSAFASHRLAARPLYPSDFRIGTLRTEGLSVAEHEARLTARAMLLEIGESEAAPVWFSEAPSGARAVAERLAQTDLRWSTVRVGRPVRLGGGEYSLPFVLQGEEGRWDGEVILERADGGWYTSDIQVSWLSREGVVFSFPGDGLPGSSW